MSKSIVVEDEADDGEARHGNDDQTFDDAADQAGVDDLEVLQGALLHDTVEDTDTTLQVAQMPPFTDAADGEVFRMINKFLLRRSRTISAEL